MVVGDSLVRDPNEIFVNGQTTVLSFGGASVAQVIKMMEFQGEEDHLDTLVIMLGTNDVSRVPVTPEGKWKPLLVCLLNELKEKYRPRLVVLCTIPQNPKVGTPIADYMNGNVTRWNEMTRSLVRSNHSELRATHGSGKHAAHGRSPRTHQGWHLFQHPAREALDKRRVPDAVEENGAGVVDNQLTGSDQFDWRR